MASNFIAVQSGVTRAGLEGSTAVDVLVSFGLPFTKIQEVNKNLVQNF